MVRIPAGKEKELELDDFLMDRTEVTNAEYKVFVDGGGYQKPEYWKQQFVENGRTLSWDEAVGRFRDTTGRAGPAGWELGRFPTGQETHPVTGVSWFEAAAYAEFVGKSLPTAYHWTRAARLNDRSIVVPGSNFAGSGTVPVGSVGALNQFGTYDLAGNAKEWCWNEREDHRRLILGGGFGEPIYMFDAKDAQPPWQRKPNCGFRCVKLLSKPPSAALATFEVPPWRDFSKEKPVSDEAFRAFKGLYEYDKRDLAVRLDAKEESEEWTMETVSFDAGYASERVLAYLFLPRNVRPPFQTVVYFPGGPARQTKSDPVQAIKPYADSVPRSGRALLYPVFKGTYQRSDELAPSTDPASACYRDHRIAWAKDLRRSIDFLETRKDIDHEKLAYLGFSWGGCEAPVMLAVEERFRVAILVSGGLEPDRYYPEADPFNFGSHVRIPVLMLNGRYDHVQPLEASQLPLLRLLGTPDKDKKHVIYESGHAPGRKDVVRESLAWLDNYLGPVKR
jgi:dienelactone hydrolase